MKKYIFWIVFAIGFFLRAVEVFSGDFVFGFDHGRDFLAVKQIVSERKLTLIGPHTGIDGVFTGPGWYYLLAIPYILWEGNPYGGEVLMLLIGLIVMVMSYRLFSRVFNKSIGLIVFFLVSVSRPIFSQATMMWNPHPVSLLIIFALYYLYQFFNKRKEKFLLLAFLSIGLMYHFELTVAIVFALYTFGFLLVEKKTKISGYFKSLGVMALAFMPAIFFELRHNFIQTRSVLKFFTEKTGAGAGLGQDFIWRQKDHLKSFYSNLNSTFNLSGLANKLFILLILVSFVYLLRRKVFSKSQNKFLVYSSFFPIFTFTFYIFFPNAVWQWYLTHLYFVYIVIAAVTIYFSLKLIKPLKLVYAIFGFLMLASTGLILKDRYAHDFFDRRGTAGFKSKLEVIDYIFQKKQGKEFNLLVFTPPIYDYPYNYLVQWYAYQKYKYLPGKEIAGNLMLLIEPDYSKPWSHEGWLETVIKKGKVVETKKFETGFIVQERVIDR